MRCRRSGDSSEITWFKVLAILFSLLGGLQLLQMRRKPAIRFRDELLIESRLAAPGFVAGDKQDRSPLRIEGISDAPFAIGRAEAQLLHVGVIRGIVRIGMRAAPAEGRNQRAAWRRRARRPGPAR